MTGGIYTFACPCREEPFEAFCWQGSEVKCPDCGQTAKRRVFSAKHQGLDYDVPVLSESLGVSPNQVAEHRAMHPTIPMLDDGRVVVTSHQEYRRIRKELGFVDTSKR
jgi:hypothetical protein